MGVKIKIFEITTHRTYPSHHGTAWLAHDHPLFLRGTRRVCGTAAQLPPASPSQRPGFVCRRGNPNTNCTASKSTKKNHGIKVFNAAKKGLLTKKRHTLNLEWIWSGHHIFMDEFLWFPFFGNMTHAAALCVTFHGPRHFRFVRAIPILGPSMRIFMARRGLVWTGRYNKTGALFSVSGFKRHKLEMSGCCWKNPCSGKPPEDWRYLPVVSPHI